tara:strand:- start:12 stop:446 length:435 start_codon:yes stop_codon:yes gene_type:complete
MSVNVVHPGQAIKVADINKVEQKDGNDECHIVNFITSRAPAWYLYKNKFYEESVKKYKDGDEEVLKIYKNGIHSIPLYIVYKNHEKIGIALLQTSHLNSDNKYLLIPKTYNFGANQPGISRNYMITALNKDTHEIWKHAELLRY